MGEAGGKTPFPSPQEMASLGYKLVAYPFSLLGASILAMQVKHLNQNCGISQGKNKKKTERN